MAEEKTTLHNSSSSTEQGAGTFSSKPNEGGKPKQFTSREKDGKKGKKGKDKLPDDRKQTGGKRCRYNHIEWYKIDDRQIKDIGSIPFGFPVGSTVRGGNVDTDQMVTPGICVLHYHPFVPGMQSWPQVVSRFEAAVRAKNSRTAPYTGNDLMMAQIALASIFSFYGYIVRHLGLIKAYSYKNNYLVRPLVESLGCDYADLVSNQSNYRENINQLARDLNSLLFVKGFSLFDRWTFLNTNIFSDSNAAKTQYYMFKPVAIWKWTPKATEKGSSLTPIPVPGAYKLSALIDTCREMVENLRTDSDIKYMNADIAKAYETADIVTANEVELGFAIVPIGDTNIFDQIQNASIRMAGLLKLVPTDTVNNAEIKWHTPAITEIATGSELIGDVAALVQYASTNSEVITTSLEDPSAEDVIVMTRLHNLCRYTEQTTGQYVLDTLLETVGSEIIEYVSYFTDASLSAPLIFVHNGITATSYDPQSGALGTVAEVNAIDLAKITAFKWHPYFNALSGSSDPYREYPTDNFSIISVKNFREMNASIGYAMLRVALPKDTGMTEI